MPGFTECCNEHDICYTTCNNRKRMCDFEFEKCLKEACKKKNTNLNESKIKIILEIYSDYNI